jgi:4-hydroxybenzoyl-CoA reductase subunit beta
MINLPVFEYARPRTLEEACALLAEGGASVVAGGTDLLPNMKRRQVEPRLLVSLRGLSDLSELREQDGGLAVGAGVTLAALASHPAVREGYPALARAAELVSGPQIRSAATVGGNLCVDTRCTYYDLSESWRQSIGFCLKLGADTCRLASGGDRCWAVSSSDLAPVAVAHDARVRLVSVEGERIVDCLDLYRDDGATYLGLAPGEILTELLLPPPAGLRVTYRKVRRRGSIDFPILGVAAGVRLDDDGRCTDARLVLGAVASAPRRVRQAEEVLEGSRLEPEAIEAAADAATLVARPMDNSDLTPGYRKRRVKVEVSRAFAELAGSP